MEKIYDLIVIGGGASGMLASIITKEKNRKLNILLLEKKKELGLKLLSTGKGKCNISNIKADGFNKIKEYFNNIGINFLIDSEGRCYPKDGNALSTRDILEKKIKSLGIEVKVNESVTDVLEDDLLYIVKSDKHNYQCKNVVFATGGKSYPSLGTTGDGYVILRKLGHKINTLIPALTPIEVCEDISLYKGVRQKGKVSLYMGGELIHSELGEVQFREDAISGICVMNTSLFIKKENDYTIQLDFSGKELNKKLDRSVYEFHVKGLKGWKDAQVTLGGVDLNDVNLNNMESNLFDGIYILGETLDYQGFCGGYNLSNAWYSAIKFGENFEI